MNDDEPTDNASQDRPSLGEQHERCEHETELEHRFESGNRSPQTRDENADTTPDGDTLSPAVRRLVRQYGLDASAIRGTGPNGRLRVADVIASLGGRTDDRSDTERADNDPRGRPPPAAAVDGALRPDASDSLLDARRAAAAFTVFDAELDSWLEHRQRRRAEGTDLPLLAYFAAAAAGALPMLPELSLPAPRFDVIRSDEQGAIGTVALDTEDLVSLDAIAHALRDGARAAGETGSRFALHDYGSSGCVLAAPLPLPPTGAAVLGIGRPRRGLVTSGAGTEQGPRIGIQCTLTLTYDSHRIPLERANAFLARLVRYRP